MLVQVFLLPFAIYACPSHIDNYTTFVVSECVCWIDCIFLVICCVIFNVFFVSVDRLLYTTFSEWNFGRFSASIYRKAFLVYEWIEKSDRELTKISRRKSDSMRGGGGGGECSRGTRKARACDLTLFITLLRPFYTAAAGSFMGVHFAYFYKCLILIQVPPGWYRNLCCFLKICWQFNLWRFCFLL